MMKRLLLAFSLLAPLSAPARNTPTDTVQMYTQGSAPSSPLAGSVYQYFLTSDGFPYWKNSGGSVFGYLYSSSALTQYGVLVGAGTRAPGVLSPASDNTVLVGNTGANPSFRQILNADIDAATDIAASKVQEANGASNGGVLTTAAQDIGGEKRFLNALGVAHVSTPSNPSSGYMKLYCKNNDKCYKLTSGGAESELGGGGAGAFNIAALDTAANSWAVTKQTNSDFETSIGDWVAYADAAATIPVDMTGGSPNTTCARNTSSPINGTGDNLITITTGATRQGEGCSVDVNIPTAYRGKPIRVLFPYTTTGTISQGDIVPYAYDVTNASLLAPSTTISGITGSAGNLYSIFQTQTSTAVLRIGLHIARASNTGAVTINLDDFKVEPDVTQANIPMSDAASFTPTGSWSSNTTYSGTQRRSGDHLFQTVRIDLAGAPTSASLTVNIANGLSIDTAKLASTSNNPQMPFSTCMIRDATGPAAGVQCAVRYNSSTSVAIYAADPAGTSNTAAAVTQAAPITFASGDFIDISFAAPISGWSSGGGTSPILSLSDWTAYTPTLSSGFGTPTNVEFFYRRVGDTVQIRGSFTAGTVAASVASMTLPSGLVVDTSKVTLANTSGNPGTVVGTAGSSSGHIPVVTATGTATDSVYFAGSSTLIPQNGSASFTNTAVVSMLVQVPVSGWTSVSSGTLTAPRDEVYLNTYAGYGATNNKVPYFTTSSTVGSGITLSNGSTNGALLTVVTAGMYCMSFSLDTDVGGSNSCIGVVKNGAGNYTTSVCSLSTTLRRTMAVSAATASTSYCEWLVAGDVINPQTSGIAPNTAARAHFWMTRVTN